jgi:DNA-binding NarL/FixJ family response regulator
VSRVFHCDDSSAFRLLVREMLQGFGDIEMVGEAETLDEAIERLPDAKADVVLVDLFERERSAELLSVLREAAPGARLVVYTGMPAEHAPSGSDGYLHKSATFDELHRVITGG